MHPAIFKYTTSHVRKYSLEASAALFKGNPPLFVSVVRRVISSETESAVVTDMTLAI